MQNRYRTFRVIALLLATTLIASGLTSLFQLSNQDVYVAAAPESLDVSISGFTKLGVGEVGTYTAVIKNQTSGNLRYEWSVDPTEKVEFSSNQDKAYLTFLEATEDPYLITVKVSDLNWGIVGYASKTVYDPYTSPNVYLGAFGAPYSYLIETDGNGWYRAINGETGAIEFTSTDATTTLQNAADATDNPYLFLKNGTYPITGVDYGGNRDIGLKIPSGATLDGEKGAVLKCMSASTYMVTNGNFLADAYDGDKDITVKNIQFDGNSLSVECLGLIHCSNVKVLNCNFKSTLTHAIEINSCNGVEIQGNNFNVSGGEMIQLDIAAGGGFFSTDAGLVNLDNTPPKNVFITNNCFDNCVIGVGSTHGATAGSVMQNVQVTHNTFNGVTRVAIEIVDATGTIIDHNQISDCTVAYDRNPQVASWHTALIIVQQVANNIFDNSITNNVVRNIYSVDTTPIARAIFIGINSANSSSFYMYNTNINGNIIENNYGHAITVSRNTITTQVANNVIANLTTTDSGGILVLYSSIAQIFGNTIQQVTRNGIQIYSTASQVDIYNNQIFDVDDWTVRVEGDSVVIKNNRLTKGGQDYLYLTGGTNLTIQHNTGYTTENTLFSVANTTDSTFVFNHSLASAAESVFCSFDADTATAIKSYSWTSTATQVTVTVYVEEGLALPATMTILSAEVKFLP